MTTIIAGKDYEGNTHILGDNLAKSPNRKYRVDSKILNLQNAFVGISGPISIMHAIAQIAQDENLLFDTPSHVFEAANTIYNCLIQDWGFEAHENGIFAYSLLIVTRNEIYEVNSGREVVQMDYYGAIGSGASFAIGAIEAFTIGVPGALSFGSCSKETLECVLHIVSKLDPDTDYAPIK